MAPTVEIMDTTLRDGEQTNNVSFSPEEKLSVAKKLLTDVKVTRIEVGNALVSEGEKQAIIDICRWAKSKRLLDKIEVLGFVNGKKSVDWIYGTGCRVVNLLTKGSEKHCRKQLGKTPGEHFAQIAETVSYALKKKMDVNVYLEDWSNGIVDSPTYVIALTEILSDLGVKRVMLPDTLGKLTPAETSRYVRMMVEIFPHVHFDYHGHNDYGLATANALSAVANGAKGVHTTVNYLGERTGNTNLSEIVVCLMDFHGIKTGVNERKLKGISKLVEAYSGKRISSSKPITGDDVFTQTAGIHADGDKKGNLYASRLTPERFSRKRSYALGKLSGKASLEMNLKELNLKLTDAQKKLVLRRIIELNDLKKVITREDLPFIISSVLKDAHEEIISIPNYTIKSYRKQKPYAKITLQVNESAHKSVAKSVGKSGKGSTGSTNKGLKNYHAESEGDGGYDAFMNCLKQLEPKLSFKVAKLIDYVVVIPPGGKTDALVQTTITWQDTNGSKREFKTVGVDSDQVVAALKATIKMLNILAKETISRKGRRKGKKG